jgi:ABC-2 type transport system permease protein
MTAFVHHLSYDFRTGLRDKSLMLMNYLFPLAFYALVGLLMTQINPAFQETLIPAMIVNAILAGTLLGLPNPLVSSREAGVFRSFKINGVPSLSILVVPVLGTILHMVLVAAIITATALPFFGAALPTNWVWFAAITLLSALACAGLGALIGVVASNGRATVLLAQIIYIPSMIMGGLMMPSSMLPPSMGRVAMLLPATHAMNAYRGLAFGLDTTISPLVSLLVLASATLLAFALAIYLFQWDNIPRDKNARRQHNPLLGLLALLPYAAAILLFK